MSYTPPAPSPPPKTSFPPPPSPPSPWPRHQNRWTRLPRRKKLYLLAAALTALLALALGLGLGLSIGRRHHGSDPGDGGDGDDKPPLQPPLPPPSSQPPWTPHVGDSWQIVLLNPIVPPSNTSKLTPDVDVYDLDLFTTPASTISSLHARGKKVLCYFSGGSYEPGRPDSGEFREEDMGRELEGWPGERWLDLGSENVRRIMRERVELAGEKGCDGVDVDNVDGYDNNSLLPLTPTSSISFLSYLSSLTTPLNLTLGLKNAASIIPTVLPIIHFSVNEQCVDEHECDLFQQFVEAGKPVFHIEYPKDVESKMNGGKGKGEDGGAVLEKYCGERNGVKGFSTVLKRMDLDGWVGYCDGKVEVTGMEGGSGS
ncbi:hypothetical protein GQ43DRAFT_407646 [Delitschia confertaspora ATCC 74209]|uniref:alpha-galactosidase n=1 Tax=Delitschia confertaspora ATCC 74209 TaxID=1513339 RepID=A0A9P4MW15_9PLEO|nr:hypothetical protein GQ43DRAFT_407646 [Delitschia confertaspora ATCC 74209]